MLRTFIQSITDIHTKLADKCPQYCGRILTLVLNKKDALLFIVSFSLHVVKHIELLFE